MTDNLLKSIVERIERLEEEQKDLLAKKRGIYVEAALASINTKALRKLIRERKKEAEKAEVAATLDVYRAAPGMVADAVSSGEATIRQSEKTSGISRSAIHREVSHKKEYAFRRPPNDMSELVTKYSVTKSTANGADPHEKRSGIERPADDELDLPGFLPKRRS